MKLLTVIKGMGESTILKPQTSEAATETRARKRTATDWLAHLSAIKEHVQKKDAIFLVSCHCGIR